jgi:isopenicillin N synthase-like dioxygenase
MSAIEELMGYKKNGLEFGILGRAILEIIERVEALEDHNDVDKYYPEEEPAPAPDLDAKILKHVQMFYDNQKMSISALLRAFAEELGVK